MIDEDLKNYLDRSVLCWLATSSTDNIPNVSPKEAFLLYQNESIIIANIASPQTVKNIKENDQICLSILDIFTQKGFQLKGTAEIITKEDTEYTGMKEALEQLTQGKFPFASITKITVTKRKAIIAPSYLIFPDTTEEDQINASKRSYRVRSLMGE